MEEMLVKTPEIFVIFHVALFGKEFRSFCGRHRLPTFMLL